jgi:hypothetical protein
MKGVLMSKSKKIINDQKHIIQIQELIIKKISSERDQVEKLWHHYLDKSTEGWSWYGKYYHAYNNLIKKIREFDKTNSSDNDNQLEFDFGGDHE